jgi:hypothetical protein
MRHQDLETDAQLDLQRIVRSVDKKLQHQVQDGPTSQDPFLTLTISQGQSQASMELSVEELRRACENDRDRHLLRERIKRTRERMWFAKRPKRYFDTSAIRPGSESFANFRSNRR